MQNVNKAYLVDFATSCILIVCCAVFACCTTRTEDKAPEGIAEASGVSVPPDLAERLNVTLDPRPDGSVGVLSKRLTAVKDNVELTGVVGYIKPPDHGEDDPASEHLPVIRSYSEFKDDSDIVFNLQLNQNGESLRSIQSLTYTNASGQVAAIPIEDGTVVHCEAVAFARKKGASGQPDVPVFPGWLEEKRWSMKIDGVDFWSIAETPEERTARFEKLWTSLRGKVVTVRGALVVDIDPMAASKAEIHPIYEIRVR